MKEYKNTTTGEIWTGTEVKEAYIMFAAEAEAETGKAYECFEDWLEAMVKAGELEEIEA